MFNKKNKTIRINGFVPHKRTEGKLTPERATFNTSLRKMRVVVENSLAQLKNFRILVCFATFHLHATT